jgi:hypothetical protein
MDTIPFADEILEGKGNNVLDYAPTIPDEIRDKVEKLDAAQCRALVGTLKSRVSLIHGPPGTGKTFIGVLLAQAIVATTNEQILCVCYTNHALDDFLVDLLDAGIADIVRLGGRSKNGRLEQYNLRERVRSGKAPFSREQNRRYAQLMGQIETAEKDMKRLELECIREIGAKWWRTVGPYLHDTDSEFWQQLHIKDSDLTDKDGFKLQGVEGEDYLWKRWLKGAGPSKAFLDRANLALWQMSKKERSEQKLVWQHGMFEEQRRELSAALSTIQRAKSEIQQLRSMQDSEVLAKARVIGCTTTKAAMCKQLLDEVSAGVILVEGKLMFACDPGSCYYSHHTEPDLLAWTVFFRGRGDSGSPCYYKSQH